MLLEAELQQFVDAVAAHPLPDDLRALRAISESTLPQLQGAPQPVAHVIEHTLTTRDGHAVELRLYTPDGLPDGPAPALLFAHGGGWFQCSLAVYDGPCRALANSSGCVIVAVGYRLAPEHPFRSRCMTLPMPGSGCRPMPGAWDWTRSGWRLVATALAAILLRPAACCCAISACRSRITSCCCTRHWMPTWAATPTASTPMASTSTPS